MGKFLVNLLICFVAFPLVFAVASFLSFAWAEAFISNRTFSEYFGFISGGTLLAWAFYVAFFFAVGLGLSALLRTNRTLAWAVAFGCTFSLYRFIAGTNYIFHPSAYVYVRLAGEYLMPVVGCGLGAIAGRKISRMAPNNSFKPKPLRGSA